MKRFAAHYLYLQGLGYLKQYAVEVDNDKVVGLSPCMAEVENTEWLPGVLMLHTTENWREVAITPQIINEIPTDLSKDAWRLTHLYPYNFTSMMPCDETRHKQLL